MMLYDCRRALLIYLQCQFVLPHAYEGYVSSPQQGMSHVIHVQLSLH